MAYGQYSYNGLENGPEHARRARTSFPTHELPHVWAHQTARQGRCPASMSFDGPDFYSYTTVIASITKAKDGRTVYLVSDGHYSISTSRHESQMRRAIPHDALTVTVPAVERGYSNFSSAQRIMDAWKARIHERVEDAGKAREPKKSRLLSEAVSIAEAIRSYAKLMGAKTGRIPRIPANVAELAAYMERAERREAAQQKAAQRKREKDEAQRRELAQADLAKWCAGEEVSRYSLYCVPCALRIVGDTVETSEGASFPVAHAVRGLALVRSVMARGEDWQTNGHTLHLGHFSVRRITADGTVYAGCHIVQWSAIERIAPELDAYQRTAHGFTIETDTPPEADGLTYTRV